MSASPTNSQNVLWEILKPRHFRHLFESTCDCNESSLRHLPVNKRESRHLDARLTNIGHWYKYCNISMYELVCKRKRES